MKNTFVTTHEIKRLQALRDAGLSARNASREAGRSWSTIKRHTTGKTWVAPDNYKRNHRLLQLAHGVTGEAREALAIEHGFANAQSMNVQLYKHRRRLREAGQVFAEAAE